GVYRRSQRAEAPATCRPHARGGVPPNDCEPNRPRWSSPRAWGCTVVQDYGKRVGVVVPTRVGVYRRDFACYLSRYGRPHARGGVPLSVPPPTFGRKSSPRAWGCTATVSSIAFSGLVVPTRVGVYRRWS